MSQLETFAQRAKTSVRKVMENTKIELNRVKIGALFGLIISILMILLAIYFTPDYIASNLSPDGFVELEREHYRFVNDLGCCF